MAIETSAPSMITGSSVTIVSRIAGVKVVPTAAPVTNCPAARACHSERTGTPASPSAAVISSDPVIHGSGKFRRLGDVAAGERDAKVASRTAAVMAISASRVRGASGGGASAAGDCRDVVAGTGLGRLLVEGRLRHSLSLLDRVDGFILDFGRQRQRDKARYRALPAGAGADLTHVVRAALRKNIHSR